MSLFVCFFFVCLFGLSSVILLGLFSSNLKTESSLATCVELQG